MPPFSSDGGTGIPEITVMEEMKERKVFILHLRKEKSTKARKIWERVAYLICLN